MCAKKAPPAARAICPPHTDFGGKSDTTFKLVGKNLEIANEYDLKELLVIGKTIQFVTAPRYFGDGYVMPIVGLTVDGTVILDKETGIKNWNDWLAAH